MTNCESQDKRQGDCRPWCTQYCPGMSVAEMFEMQAKLQNEMFGYTLPVDSVEDFKYSVLALVGELGEVLDADKRWKNIRNGKCSKESKLDELVDCMAFIVNMVLFSGFTAEEFAMAFNTKNAKNFKRYWSEQESKKT